MNKLINDLYKHVDGNPKTLLTLVTAGLKKFPEDPTLQAFKALALDRSHFAAGLRKIQHPSGWSMENGSVPSLGL